MTCLLIILGTLALALTQVLIFLYAPTEASLGLCQKIFYLHLPLAWWGLISFFIVFIASIVSLLKPKPWAHALALASAEIGEVLAILTVITGMIWGRVAWGVWWTWDPRLSTALILCFIYAGYLLLNQLDLTSTRRQKLAAILGILGFLDVPLVFMSARLWRSIHPAVFTSQGAAMSSEMLITLLVALGSFGVWWAGLIRLRFQILKNEEQIDQLETLALQKNN